MLTGWGEGRVGRGGVRCGGGARKEEGLYIENDDTLPTMLIHYGETYVPCPSTPTPSL